MNWLEFRQLIAQHFDIEELRTLCFDLDVDYDALRGEGKAAKVRELIALFRRNSRMPEFVAALSRHRPQVSWRELVPKDKSFIVTSQATQPKSTYWLTLAIAVIFIIILYIGWVLFVLIIKLPSSSTPGTTSETAAITRTLTLTLVLSPTNTPEPSQTPTRGPTHIPTQTNTTTRTATPTNTTIPTNTPTHTLTFTPTPLPEPTSTSTPTLAPTVKSSSSTYLISPASDECQDFYRYYDGPFHDGHHDVTNPDLISYSITTNSDYDLVWASSMTNAEVYGLLICHFDLAPSVVTATISFDEGNFECGSCGGTIMNLRVYPGYKEIEEGTNPDTVITTADALLFYDIPPPANTIVFTSTSSAPNHIQFTDLRERTVTIVVGFADGWDDWNVTARLSNFRLETQE